MHSLSIDRSSTSTSRTKRFRSRLWRDWCFARAIIERRGISLLILLALLVAGGLLFPALQPGQEHTFLRSMYYTWNLVFAQPPPTPFPTSIVLRVFFFLVPFLGLTLIIEAIVEISHMLRDRRRNEDTWCRIMAKAMNDHIILVGLGRLGIRTFHLLRRLGHDVVVIERKADAQFLEDVRRDGSPILIGDARREAFLVDANVQTARSVVLATTDDLANLEIALDARRINPKVRVVMRMFDPEMAEKVREGFQIRSVMSAASLAAPAFAMAALERGIVNSAMVDDHLLVTQIWNVAAGGPLDGKTVAELMEEHEIGVVRLHTKIGDTRLFPKASTRVSAGDELLVQGSFEVLVKHELGSVAR
jgi:Trk K+ transport system NAD-binding subunit